MFFSSGKCTTSDSRLRIRLTQAKSLTGRKKNQQSFLSLTGLVEKLKSWWDLNAQQISPTRHLLTSGTAQGYRELGQILLKGKVKSVTTTQFLGNRHVLKFEGCRRLQSVNGSSGIFCSLSGVEKQNPTKVLHPREEEQTRNRLGFIFNPALTQLNS